MFGFFVIFEDCILIFFCLFKVCIYGMDEFFIDFIEIDFLGSLVKNKLECWLEIYLGNCCYGFFFIILLIICCKCNFLFEYKFWMYFIF